MDKIAVVSVNYNMPEVIQYNIDVLKKNSDVPMDFIVVDNGSNEEYMFIPESDDIHMVYLDYNLHHTHGYRMGFNYAKSL